MLTVLHQKKLSFIHRLSAATILLCFLATTVIPPSFAQEIVLPAIGTRVALSESYNPPLLKGIKIYPDNPFRLDFILNNGNSNDSVEQTQSEATGLVKYFLTAVTVPENDLWVNLSPYEKNRIVPNAFGVTEMGRDLLAQDYLLKQITASVIYPEEKIGKEFWTKVHAESQKRFGTTDIPIDTFNKVWIVPEKAVIYENKDAAYVVETHLKVMLEKDYMAMASRGALSTPSDVASSVAGAPSTAKAIQNNVGPNPPRPDGLGITSDISSSVIREVVLPILEKEVNEGKNFAQLRQIYHSLILAIWFKDKIRQSIFGQAYVDHNKISGVDIADKTAKEKIWAQYTESFKKGAYNYIKEEVDPLTQEALPRKYFSGGAGLNETRRVIQKATDKPNLSSEDAASSTILTINLTASEAASSSVTTPFLKNLLQNSGITNPLINDRFLTIAHHVLNLRADADIKRLYDVYEKIKTHRTQTPPVYSTDLRYRIFNLETISTVIEEGRGLTNYASLNKLYRNRIVQESPFLSYLKDYLHIQGAYLKETAETRTYTTHSDFYEYSHDIYIPREFEDFMEFYFDAGSRNIDEIIFKKVEEYIQARVEKGVRLIGRTLPGASLGNKEAGFLVFDSLGLNYPPGIALSEQLVNDMLMRPEKESHEFISFIEKKLQQAGIDISQVRFAVRSNPKQSMPGILETVTDINDLSAAIRQVAMSWYSDKAKLFRKTQGLNDAYDLPIIIQVWVSGQKREFNQKYDSWDYHYDYQQRRLKDTSLPFYGAGVFSTRNPNTNDPGLYGRYVENADGENLMTKGESGEDIQDLAKTAPNIYRQLLAARSAIESKVGPQEVEFVVHNGKIYFLQTRNINFTPHAEIAYIQEQLSLGKITEGIAIPKIEKLQQSLSLRKIFKIKAYAAVPLPLAKAEGSTRGALQGHLVWDIAKARELMSQGKPIIFVASYFNQNEVLDIIFNYPHAGLITNYGNNSSHEAVLTRLAGIPSLINLKNAIFQFSGDQQGIFLKNGTILSQEDLVVLDADNNSLFITHNDVLQEDPSISDASYGIDIPALRKKFNNDYLDADGNLKPEYTIKRLKELNDNAFVHYETIKRTTDAKAVFIANLEKHFLHDLLNQARELKRKNETEEKDSLRHITKGYWDNWTQKDLDYLIGLYSDALSHHEEIKLLSMSILANNNSTKSIDAMWQNIFLKRVLRAIYRKLLIYYVDARAPNQVDFDNQELFNIIAKALGRSQATLKQDINFFESHPDLESRLDYINTNKGFLIYVKESSDSYTLESFVKYSLPLLGDDIIFDASGNREFLHSTFQDYSYIAVIVPESSSADTLINLKSFKRISFAEYFDNSSKYFASSRRIISSFANNLPQLLEEKASSGIDDNHNSKIDTKGGIDLTGEKMRRRLSTTGNSVEFQFTPEMINRVQNAPGFVPVIINTQPLLNLPMFLGLKENETLSVATAEKL